MADLVRLSDHRRQKGKRVTFDRQELRQLLDVYSRRVASGEWKDYAIDLRHGAAIFSIFRHTFDLPVFTVAKISPAAKSSWPQIWSFARSEFGFMGCRLVWWRSA